MDAEAKRAREQMKKLPFKKKLENFWFYYRIHVFVAIFCVILLGGGMAKCAMQQEYDMSVSLYCTNPIDTKKINEIVKILEEHSIDINDNNSVDVNVITYVGDITLEVPEPQTQAIYVKLQAEIVSNACAGYIMDENYKNFVVEGYEGATDKVVDLSTIPEVKARLGLSEDEKLYWVSAVKTIEGDNSKQFVNGERVEKYFEENVK
ncbi:MAG: hypothetical protein IKW62_03055 [Clostridia bacterium]|nr:hypothetical protein [Clostridia bacterium]